MCWIFLPLTFWTDCNALNEQLCSQRWFRICVSGLKTAFKGKFYSVRKKKHAETQKWLHLKILLYWCLSWFACGYFTDRYRRKKFRMIMLFVSRGSRLMSVYLLTPIFHHHLQILDVLNRFIHARQGTVEQGTSASSTRADGLKIGLILGENPHK